ncbi:MAG TPA: YbjN domain-containing protein [Thermohalobaculum sp.]|nr:YbjN domain-containing protein [Thermohalobaculum sp.]
MTVRRFAAVLVLLAVVAVPKTGQALYGLIDGSQPSHVLDVAQLVGEAALGLDGAGDPMIRGRIGRHDYRIYFYGCRQGTACKNLTFAATWESDHYSDRSMGDWNRSRRFGTAYIDDSGNPTLAMTLNLHGGISRWSLEESFDWWRVLMDEFSEYFGF